MDELPRSSSADYSDKHFDAANAILYVLLSRGGCPLTG